MKHYYIVLLFLILLSCDLFEKESKPKDIYGCMDSTATNYNPEATIDDGSCEYCVDGASFILLSTNSGVNWKIKCLQEEIGDVSDISMIDSNNIWLCTNAHDFLPFAQIMHTNDGGKTWIEQYSFDNSILGQVSFEYIEMFDLKNGIALANDWSNYIPIFLKTTDGGNNWAQTTTEPIGISGNIWRRVDFVDVNTGYFFESGENPQKLLKTINSGLTWQDTNFDDYAYVLKFYDDEIGITNVRDGIRRTLDGGNTWKNIEGINTTWSEDIEFYPNDPSRVWILSDSLYFSSDTGSSWTECIDNSYKESEALKWSDSNLWVYNMRRYLRKVDINNCTSYIEYQLPEYPYGDMALGFNFDVVGDVIVIPGYFAE